MMKRVQKKEHTISGKERKINKKHRELDTTFNESELQIEIPKPRKGVKHRKRVGR